MGHLNLQGSTILNSTEAGRPMPLHEGKGLLDSGPQAFSAPPACLTPPQGPMSWHNTQGTAAVAGRVCPGRGSKHQATGAPWAKLSGQGRGHVWGCSAFFLLAEPSAATSACITLWHPLYTSALRVRHSQPPRPTPPHPTPAFHWRPVYSAQHAGAPPVGSAAGLASFGAC